MAADDDPPTLVKDARSLISTCQRLSVSNDAVVFWNVDNQFKIMLRNDPIDQDTCGFDISIMTGDDDDDVEDLSTVLSLEHDGYFDDEPGMFVLETMSFARDAAPEDASVVKAMETINRIYGYRLCPCRSYLIKDSLNYDTTICTFCQLTATAAELEPVFCPICQDSTIRKHMTVQACCNQELHRSCLETWLAKSDCTRCPLCRG